MKVYKLRFMIKGPDDEQERPYVAEVPSLPGCRAWGDTPAEALENLQSVTTAFIQSYQGRGDSLPREVEAALVEEGDQILGDVSVAV